MSSRYTADGKRLSSMTHARRCHPCEFCDRAPFGNGGMVAHARSHVRSGQAVELVIEYPYTGTSRIFLPSADTDRIRRFIDDGYVIVER